MGREFFSQRISRGVPLSALALPETEHPFCTDAYVTAMQKLGNDCWIVGMRAGGAVQELAIAMHRRGRISSTLEIPSLPEAAQDYTFWTGIYSLCRQLRVTNLIAGTFFSPQFRLPSLRGEVSRRERGEYVVSLQNESWDSSLSSNHKRNIKKASAAGLKIEHALAQPDLLSQHVRLMEQSLDRRAARGESVTKSSKIEEESRAYIESGAGELYQAVRDGIAMSSILLLRSKRSAYYQSAGTSPEGMSVGASHFLIHRVCQKLRDNGVRVFNLGGAPEGSSLARFKAGFGAAEISLAACCCYLGPGWLKKIRTAVTLLRSDRGKLWQLLRGSRYRLLVYARQTDLPSEFLTAPPETHFKPLSEESIRVVPVTSENREFREKQLERFRRLPGSCAYGVYVRESLAHVSWLYPASVVALEEPQILPLTDSEAEISGCETLPEFRGKNLYSFAIQNILRIARDMGIRRIYMKTLEDNSPSQSGILKAGLSPIGSVTVLTPPLISGKKLILRRLKGSRLEN
jgi:RimJ/RimL family protein N-acetyltransferase